jgi:hypothetical protein
MNQSFNLRTTTLAVRNWIALAHGGRSFFVILLALALTCFALSPAAQAQDGDELNDNTAEGSGALHTYTTTANSSTHDTALGFDTLFSNTTGSANTAAGALALELNTNGSQNTAIGDSALNQNTDGNDNTAIGVDALFSNTTGSANTATGVGVLNSNTTGGDNTATGFEALLSNTTGGFNTATGAQALFNNTTGNENTANGVNALTSNTTGHDNTANGDGALNGNTTGSNNTATGAFALLSNTGDYNTADGLNALAHNNSGGANTATGVSALFSNTTGSTNTACGILALERNTTGKSNIALGVSAGANLTTGDNNIDIGNVANAAESNTIRIGTVGTQIATFITGIQGVAVTGSPVVGNTNGQLGVAPSSARFKEAIKPMDNASEAILALKPVTFRYKKELDPEGIPQFGLVAEQVEKVNPDLVARDEQGKPYTVRYEAVNAMLLNEFLKEHSQVQQLKTIVAQQQKQIEALTATVQKVNDRLLLNNSEPQLVANDH